MTIQQELDLNNALLTLMYEWKIGMVDQKQALKEFKQCLKYYSIVDNVMLFEDAELKDIRIFEHYGEEKIIPRIKQELSERIVAEVVKNGCVCFEEVPTDQWRPGYDQYRHFRMRMEVIIPKQKQDENNNS